MKITQVYRTRNGVVGPTSINGYGIIKIDGLRYDKDENKYYDSEDNEVILEEGREYYSNNKLYVYDGKLTELLTDLMIEVKYVELVELRDNKELIPGSLYRITDYENNIDVKFDGLTSHQFDIVLLALTPNSLSEEGWVAMHYNIYDVTFYDGVAKKCYIYCTSVADNEWSIIDYETLLGVEGLIEGEDEDFILNEENNTATTIGIATADLNDENLTYNYFQNSKLEAWKVWYCLDNDKTRFSWADDRVAPEYIASSDILNGEILKFQGYLTYNNVTYRRYGTKEQSDRYWEDSDPNNIGWVLHLHNQDIQTDISHYTKDELEEAFSNNLLDAVAIYYDDDSHTLIMFEDEQNCTSHSNVYIYNARGVIYRLTDEEGDICKLQWNELKTIRDSKALVADTKYRIIDYQCTTTQENTRSAGHQFDIVLLALSANKLAEEGWAMMHDNIYDVTFNDEVIKKCYIIQSDEGVNVIIKDNLLGISNIVIGEDQDIVINETQKTARCYYLSTDLDVPNITYNYFKNSNLSAWKVWYSLDNDKSRFTWADDSVDESTEESITAGAYGIAVRSSQEDMGNKYAWDNGTWILYTNSATPNIGDSSYLWSEQDEDFRDTGNNVTSYTPTHEGTNLPNGRGVIYRLIDEWNNDVPYDFKNIMFKTKVTDGLYDSNGTYQYVYTFSIYNYSVTPGLYLDGSILSGILLNQGDTIINRVENNIITKFNNYGSIEANILRNPNILFGLMSPDDDRSARIINVLLKDSQGCKLNSCINIIMYYCQNIELSDIEGSSFYNSKDIFVPFNPTSNCIMMKNKKVLVES